MANFYGCLCLQRVALPLILLSSIAFRPSGLSAIYLLLLLYLPFVPVATPRSMRGHTGYYLRAVVALSFITSLTQLAFQIVLLAHQPYAVFLEDCKVFEKILRHVGLVRLNGISAKDCITWLAPEVVMLISSVAIYVLCGKLSAETTATENTTEQGESHPTSSENNAKKRKSNFIVCIGRYVSLMSLCVAGVLRPSVPNSIYFLMFIGSASWWACYKELRRGYAIALRILLVLITGHIIALYAYQFQWIQEFFPPDNRFARYFGITRLLSVNCIDPRTFHFEETEWASYVNPFALFWLYYVIVFESALLMQPQLIRGVSPSQKYGSGKRATNLQEALSGGASIAETGADDIPMEQLEDEYKPGIFEQIIYSVASVFYIITRSSYLATNIIMMAWSITYHSWLTFVLLIWANLLWLFPNQRRSMLRSSPFIVIYAEFLLLAQYVYGMNLTESELPSSVKGINLAQIGFYRPPKLPCNPLLIKSLFTAMFWITMRQFMKERQEERQSSTLADMVAPLQVTVGAATASMNQEPEIKPSKVIQILGKLMKDFLTKFWIWVVAIMLFVIGITGTRMTGFRIIYMALFLIFVLTFQLSWSAWRKMMYGFWLTVIIYSMAILVLIYTYQFDNFKEYWRIYLKVPYTLQLDIGLELFETTQLFVRLLIPTFFVIITVIQMHYFHKDFLEISNVATRSRTTSVAATDIAVRSDTSSAMGGPWDPSTRKESEVTDTEMKPSHSLRFKIRDIRKLDKDQLKQHFIRIKSKVSEFLNLVWLFLELHTIKVVLVSMMLLCVYDIGAIHFFFMVLATIALACSSHIQILIKHCLSIMVSIMFLARMIYQIEYIQHEKWNVVCEIQPGNDPAKNVTYNSAEWLGFYKTDSKLSLAYLLKGYIGFILVVIIHAVVNVRQTCYRILKGKPLGRQYLMFPSITRADADKDTFHCIKYLFNYGFYKFGIEISLITTVGLIGSRMDLYSVFYGIWLCILFSMSRTALSKIWPFYMAFIVIIIPIQYFMVVGLPPFLCIEYPWDDSETLRRTQDWAFLLDNKHTPPAHKLICDFFLLLLVARQALVFRIERRYCTDTNLYPGGTNRNIIKNADIQGFVNPVPDFVTFLRSWLDVWKRGILMGFLWVSLAVVFLAGTKRVNIFSVGYLVGSFIFLWQGSDLYLRPIKMILRSWNYLLGYNVAVIFLKTIFQIIGCIFLKEVGNYACWPIQLFGIGCISKFGSISVKAGFSDADECVVPREDIGLAWDGFCFAFLILQRRLFKSYYFFHIVDETKAMTILASRGAELIEELREKQIAEQEVEEHKILEKIKQKMDKIKANQQKIQGPSYSEPTNHFVDTIFSPQRPLFQDKRPDTYKTAIRSGDYYMFDTYDDEEELDLDEEKKEEEEDDLDKGAKRIRQLTLGEQTDKRGELETLESGDELDEKKDDDKEAIGKAMKPPKAEDEPLSTLSAITGPEEKEEPLGKKICNFLLFAWAFLQGIMLSITLFLNKFSRDYRYVIRVLTKEKKILKEKNAFRIGIRRGSGQVWQPVPASYDIIKKSSDRKARESIIDEETSSKDGSVHTSIEAIIPLRPRSESDDSEELFFDSYESPALLEDYEGAEMSSADQPPLVQMLLSMWFLVLSHSDLVCYFVIFLNQIKSASIISIPLPVMVFLWGSLTIPRPTKTFWVTIIAYTEVIVIIKCIFQFEILPWNHLEAVNVNPFSAPKIIGIERKPNYASYDLLLLLIVFFHRFMLKSLGLWKSSYAPLPLLQNTEYQMEGHTLYLPPSNNGKESGESSIKSTPIRKVILRASFQEDHQEQDVTRESPDVSFKEKKIVTISTEESDSNTRFPEVIKLSANKYMESIRCYFEQLLDPTSRVAADVYAYMFMCDFFNFMVVIFGFAAFGTQQGDGGVSAYLQENKVPVPFLLMLILQFILIIIDRALYLRKFILGKIIFQYFMIFGVHIWMFFVLPAVTERPFNALLPPQMWYMVKCFYLLLSAYQIRCGYPTRILGNFLCKGYNYVNMFLFKGFMLVPFLFELRTIMDWMWTDTSMTIFDWLKMEDIFAHIFQLKCTRHVENEYPQPRGQKKPSIIKYIMGGAGLLVIIGIIWFPLVLFALGNTVGQPNIPYDVTVNLRIGPYQPIFSMSAQNNTIFTFNEQKWNVLSNVYGKNRVAQTFLSNYEYDDVAAVRLNGNSTMVWNISPPDQDRLIEELNSTKPIVLRMQYTVSRISNNKENSGIVNEQLEVTLKAEENGIRNPIRDSLLQMLNGTENIQPVLIAHLFPKFLKVTNLGRAVPVPQLMLNAKTEEDSMYRNISLKLSHSPSSATVSSQQWWELREDCTDYLYENILNKLPFKDCDYLVLYTFNEKSFPASLSVISGSGIIGLYSTLVFVASRVVRGVFSDICFKIMFDDMPNVDRIFQLCLDIYLVRESCELSLEEDLFAKLVFLFRSPETLIKWTRPKEEAGDEDPDDQQMPSIAQ